MVSANRIILAAAAGLAGAALCAGPSAAQSIADRCRALPTEAERFACMEGALAVIESMRGGEMVAPQVAPSSSSSSRAASGLGAEQVDRDRDSGGRGWLRMPSIDVPFIGGGDDRDEVRPVAASPSDPAGLGAEQVRTRNGDFRDGDEDVVHATIVSFEERVPGQWQFELDNGQIWRQLSGDSQQIRLGREEQPEVEMWSSWAGGYRMRIVGERQMVKVERIR